MVRVWSIVKALFASCLAASLCLLAVMAVNVMTAPALSADMAIPVSAAAMAALGYFGLYILVGVLLLGAVPAIPFIVMAECFRLRSILIYLAAASLISIIAFAVFRWAVHFQPSTRVFSIFPIPWTYVVCGWVAGAVYWRLAGRHAGERREPLK
ncbi:MAG: hypothetical protein A4S14_14260 [Proteobacteria bacterium SG_bin9]|nr:MAG: hypothetical protein A4S14_14260 [Proteobacteria bacterium SG_bin9]